jgi:hypothetical protein
MDFLAVIKRVAPILAGTFGTPLAGLAVSAICSVLPGDKAQEVQQAETAAPGTGALGKLGDLFAQGILKAEQIKQAESAHAEKMAELGYKNAVDLETLSTQDRASARAREVAVKDRTPSILAYILIAGTGVAIAGTLLGYTKIDSALSGTLIGYLVAECRTALAYFFGTTASGQVKDATISEIAKS